MKQEPCFSGCFYYTDSCFRDDCKHKLTKNVNSVSLHKTRDRQRAEAKKALVQKPVAYMDADGNFSDNDDYKCFPIPLYTEPPQHALMAEYYKRFYEELNAQLQVTAEKQEPVATDDAGIYEFWARNKEAEKQEPVGEVKDLFTNAAWERLDVRGSTKVYLEYPPQRQPLTVVEIINSAVDAGYQHMKVEDLINITRAIEAAHGIKE